MTIPKFKFRIDENGFRTSFSSEQDIILKENYLEIPVKRLCSIIKKSSTGILSRMKQLNLIIPQELADKRKKIGMFRNGQIPPNKGKKQSEYMSYEAIERTKATRFKSNHIPHNAKQDWDLVKRRDSSGYYYWMIKLPENRKLVYKHIWIWENEYGKIEKGFNIVFKDGNSLHCVIENLEKISNAELLKRNSVHRFPEELRKIIQLKGALKRQINKLQKSEKNGH